MDEPAATPAPAPAAAHAGGKAPPLSALRLVLRLALPALGVLLLLAAAAGALLATAYQLLATDAGTRWLLTHLPHVEVAGSRGALLGPAWQADGLRIDWDSGRAGVAVDAPRVDGLHWRWRPDGRAWAAIAIDRIAARRVDWRSGPAKPATAPPQLPANIAPPLRLAIASVAIDELAFDGATTLTAVALDAIALDPDPGGAWSVRRYAARGWGVGVEGSLTLGTAAPLPLALHATLRPVAGGDAPRWAAVVDGSGSVERPQLNATLRGVPVGRQAEAPTLDLHSTLQPLQPWMLAALSLDAEHIDLAALVAQAPVTWISGHAKLSGGDGGSPLEVALALANTGSGRWDEGRLPVQRLTLQARGELAHRERVEVPHFELALGASAADAGRWSGNAVWQGHELTLATTLADVRPQALDRRAPAMTLAGPLAATLTGLPSPAGGAAPPWSANWKFDLQGRGDAAPQPVRLSVDGHADAQGLLLRRAHAETGGASADLDARIARASAAAGAGWKVASKGDLRGFDPQPWWPGGAWRTGETRISGHWQFDVEVPAAAAAGQPLLAWAPRLAGNGRIALSDSTLGGVPLAADFTLGYAQRKATLAGDLQLGRNRVHAQARGDPEGNGADDHLQLDIDAAALADLAPLVRQVPALAAWTPGAGSATASIAVDGRWPRLRSGGQAQLQQVQLGQTSQSVQGVEPGAAGAGAKAATGSHLALARGSAKWTFDNSATDEPLSLALEFDDIRLDQRRADHLRLQLDGTLARHRIVASAAAPMGPTPMAERVLGIQTQSGTLAQLSATGSWLPDAGGGGRWRARIERLVVGSWDGSPDDAPPASGWANARDLAAELRFDADGHLASLSADAGRLRIADAIDLHWDALEAGFEGDQRPLRLRAEIEPFALAPLLARAQPEVGWQGDLQLGARVDLRFADSVDAELVFERRSGDLGIASGDGGLLLLGLTEAKLAISAHDGVWNATETLRGRTLGDVEGRQQVRSEPSRRWPEPEAPIEGELHARVADIGIWSAWVPPGWRLAGQVRTDARIGGRFGAPTWTGEFDGSGLAVRNLLQGVNVANGSVNIKLGGETATIEHFTLDSGGGKLTLSGGATLGAQPRAQVQIKADHLRLLGRVDRLVTVSGQAQLLLDAHRGSLDGAFTIDEALVDMGATNAPALDDDVDVTRPGKKAPKAAAADAASSGGGFVFALGLDIDLGSRTRVKGVGIDTALTGKVRLTTPGGKLAVNGRIATEGGTYAAYGQKLEIERGLLDFGGPIGNPRLDVLALRPRLDTRVGVTVTGTLLTPRVRLYSDPDMSDNDKLSWLLLGRAPDSLGRNDTALLQSAAVALLSGEGEAPTDAVLKALGIDDLSLHQSDTDTHETVVAVGKQLSQRWYLGYERGVNATAGNWQLTYRIAQRFTLRLQSGLDNAVDLIWTWRVGQPSADAAMRKSTYVPP
ncbi:MAG: translocation/assembly module TamB domain-containing protein [Burkholderiales bacterium]|nr:translocation/assembly module TamB domain-containing protein [Burkholderiales bacterium]